MTDTKVLSKIVNRVLDERVGAYGFRGATVSAGEDHDGEPALFIDAQYDRTEGIDPEAFYGLTSTLREALASEAAEFRFPYIRHHFHEDQRVAV